MLQALMPRFAQSPPTLDLDVYGSMILDVPLFLFFVLIKAGGFFFNLRVFIKINLSKRSFKINLD